MLDSKASILCQSQSKRWLLCDALCFCMQKVAHGQSTQADRDQGIY